MVLDVNGARIGVAICEDIWQDGGPVAELAEQHIDLLLTMIFLFGLFFILDRNIGLNRRRRFNLGAGFGSGLGSGFGSGTGSGFGGSGATGCAAATERQTSTPDKRSAGFSIAPRKTVRRSGINAPPPPTPGR